MDTITKLFTDEGSHIQPKLVKTRRQVSKGVKEERMEDEEACIGQNTTTSTNYIDLK